MTRGDGRGTMREGEGEDIGGMMSEGEGGGMTRGEGRRRGRYDEGRR